MNVSQQEKLKYLEEMIRSYKKGKQDHYFIEQYLRGAGNELASKFWELRSSSRMAYDLYSWMKSNEYPEIMDFQFEFLLPNLKSGGTGPNMDVFIETKHELIFIESKFTESANLHFTDNGYLKEAYYADKPYGRNNMSLVDRFWGNAWASKFSKFCTEWEEEMERKGWHKGKDWFEPKQETCHLSGILLFLFQEDNRKRIKNKEIKLYNIYWKLPEDSVSEMEQEFCARAQGLINDILSENNPGVKDFKISAFSAQEMLKDNSLLSNSIHFPSGYLELMTKRNEDILSKEGITHR